LISFRRIGAGAAITLPLASDRPPIDIDASWDGRQMPLMPAFGHALFRLS